jgi:hypothetical protein
MIVLDINRDISLDDVIKRNTWYKVTFSPLFNLKKEENYVR